MRKENGRSGYVVVEAAVLLPLASILLLLLVYLCSYLYQSCFLTQAAYVAAFRGSRFPERKEAYVQAQLDELLQGEVLSFGQEERCVEVGLLSVQVNLTRETPFSVFGEWIPGLAASRSALRRDPVAYIRGVRGLRDWRKRDG